MTTETKQEPSKGAMQAAKALNESGLIPACWNLTEEIHAAAIIDKYTRPKWIKCSERMPTEEDAGVDNEVIWLHKDGSAYWAAASPWDNPIARENTAAWFPLPPGPEEK